VKAYFGLRSFEGRSTFRHWLQRIKVNHCLNHVRRRGGGTDLSIEEQGVEEHQQLQIPATADADLDAREDRERIAAVLNAMPATLRVPLIMRDMDDFSYEEVAKALRIGLSAAKMRIKRAREQFRRLYEGRGNATREPRTE